MIFEKHANLKYKYGNRHFWCRGYYVDTVGKNTAAIKEYIQKQLKDDLEYDQMTLVEYIDPFTGEPGMWCSWQIFSAPSWRKQVIAPHRGRASRRLSRWS